MATRKHLQSQINYLERKLDSQFTDSIRLYNRISLLEFTQNNSPKNKVGDLIEGKIVSNVCVWKFISEFGYWGDFKYNYTLVDTKTGETITITE